MKNYFFILLIAASVTYSSCNSQNDKLIFDKTWANENCVFVAGPPPPPPPPPPPSSIKIDSNGNYYTVQDNKPTSALGTILSGCYLIEKGKCYFAFDKKGGFEYNNKGMDIRLSGQAKLSEDAQKIIFAFNEIGGKDSCEIIGVNKEELILKGKDVSENQYTVTFKNFADVLWEAYNENPPVVDTSSVYDLVAVDDPPKFPGGESELNKFLKSQIKITNEKRGKVFVEFIIDKKGNIKETKIYKSLKDCSKCDKEAMRVVNLMPQWTPGKQKGTIVDVRWLLPIEF